MSRKKKVIVIFLTIVLSLMLFGAWYQFTYSMDEAVAFEVNSSESNAKLLIATQGSEFKNTITNNIVNHYKKDSVYISVIDVSGLLDMELTNFDAIVVLHTWKNWKPPAVVKSFFEQQDLPLQKIVVMTTSGEGSYKMKGVDAITGESRMEHVEMHTNEIIKALDGLFYINKIKN